MASADVSITDEVPGLPDKHMSARMVTPSPATYDAPTPSGVQRPPSGTQRPPSVHSTASQQSQSVPGTASPGFGLVDPYPQGGNRNSQGSSRASSRTSIQMAPQPYPGMQGITQEPQYPQPQASALQTSAYGGGQQAVQPPSSMQLKAKAPSQRRPKPQGFKLILKSWIIMSVGTFFVNPLFGGIAIGFSIVSLISRTYWKVHKFGRLALYTCIVGIALSVILGVVAGVILGTNNKGYRTISIYNP